MNSIELKEMLMPYLDGELQPTVALEVEEALANHPECRAELEEMTRVSAFSREAIFAPVASVNLAGVYDGVMARIAAEDKALAKAAARPSVWTRASTWLSEVVRFERPMVLVGMAAALLGAVVLLSGGDDAVPGMSSGPSVADSVEKEGPKRRGAEAEVKAVARGGVFVEKLEAQKGKAFIDFDQNDPEAPMVLWHVMDGEGIQAPKGL